MCRNIKPLFNFDPPATDAEINDAALQFVRKLSGTNKPSEMNKKAFNEAVKNVFISTKTLLKTLTTNSKPKSRALEAEKSRLKVVKRFGLQS